MKKVWSTFVRLYLPSLHSFSGTIKIIAVLLRAFRWFGCSNLGRTLHFVVSNRIGVCNIRSQTVLYGYMRGFAKRGEHD